MASEQVRVVSKHNRTQSEKQQRNMVYARRFRQLRCSECGHKTSVPGRCVVCGGRIRRDAYAKKLGVPANETAGF